jgi:excinuclease ABC subunit A
MNDGNTPMVVGHNLDVIKSTNWVIALGPEGGAVGGQIIAEGRPEQVTKAKLPIPGNFSHEESITLQK